MSKFSDIAQDTEHMGDKNRTLNPNCGENIDVYCPLHDSFFSGAITSIDDVVFHNIKY